MISFDREYAATYEDRMRQRVPGYELIHDLVPSLLGAALGDAAASILVVGAGTGTELNALARHGPKWTFTALDSSADMLEVARERMRHSGYFHRVTFQVGDAVEYRGEQPHDAAVAILVAHFLPDDGTKADLFSALASNVRTGAPLVLVDLANIMPLLRSAHDEWALANDMCRDEIEKMSERFATEFNPVPDARLRELLSDAGFGAPTPFFRAFSFAGCIAFKHEE